MIAAFAADSVTGAVHWSPKPAAIIVQYILPIAEEMSSSLTWRGTEQCFYTKTRSC